MSEFDGILSMVNEIDALKQRVVTMKTHRDQFELAANEAIESLKAERGELEKQLAELQTEVKEQARLLDMSATRELGFIASLSTMEADYHAERIRADALFDRLAKLREAAQDNVDADIDCWAAGSDIEHYKAMARKEAAHDRMAALLKQEVKDE